jgi:ferredoxin
LDPGSIPDILYNTPKPVTPLKKFFLPVKENITAENHPVKPVVILGTPNCDVMALAFLDEIYLDEEYPDPAYRTRRENTTLVSMDCFSILEHCHCIHYGIQPVGNAYSDLSLALMDGTVLITCFGKKGELLIEKLGILAGAEPQKELMQSVEEKQSEVEERLRRQYAKLPDYDTTGKVLEDASPDIWEKHAAKCVSCGACSAICPTCSCFLLIDQPGFQKVRQLDTCQYPGFERVAGGEDSLGILSERFKNRYQCKYIWKPGKYKLKACTGCGRCIETCIGQINKNELILEISS